MNGYRFPAAPNPPQGKWAVAKLTAGQRDEIRRRYADGEKGSVLALEFGVSVKTIAAYTVPRRGY